MYSTYSTEKCKEINAKPIEGEEFIPETLRQSELLLTYTLILIKRAFLYQRKLSALQLFTVRVTNEN
jgi:hypothetical protein